MKELDAVLARLTLSMGPGVELGGDNVRLEQEPENGLELRITILDDAGRTRSIASVFSASHDPPPGLPADLPFVPGTAMHVIEDRDRDVLLASWRVEEDSANALTAAFERVVSLSREAGWALEERSGERTARLTREGRRRRVEAGTGTGGAAVSMAEKRVA